MWNFDMYRSEYESEEHWELREKFLRRYNGRFPEDKLVCLSKVFANVEFLGCKYPEKTMQLITELSEGICDEYRIKNKDRVQRTLVPASDAAAQRVRGLPYEFVPEHELVDENIADSSPVIDFRQFILYKSVNAMGQEETNPVDLLVHSADKNVNSDKVEFHFLVDDDAPPESDKCCEVRINGNLLASEMGTNVKEAKVNAAVAALKILSSFCYTIQVKGVLSCRNCSPKEWERVHQPQVVAVTKDGLTKVGEIQLPENNIGAKMMQRMGWTGSGLGKNKQGIQTPIIVTQKLAQKAGLGCTEKMEAKVREIISDFVVKSSTGCIVFCCDSSSQTEMKNILKTTNIIKLKTQTFVNDDRIHIVASKKVELPAVLEELLACGGENDQYLLFHPTRDDQTRSAEETQQFIMDLFEKKVQTEVVSSIEAECVSGKGSKREFINSKRLKRLNKKLKREKKKEAKLKKRSTDNNDLISDVPNEAAEPNMFSNYVEQDGESISAFQELSEVAHQNKFHNRMQRNKESIDAFGKALQSLAANCNFSCAGCNTSNIDLHLRIQFIRGLKSSCIRERLFRESELTFSRATELALNMESPTQVPTDVKEEDKFSNGVQEDGESVSASPVPSEAVEQNKFHNGVEPNGESIDASPVPSQVAEQNKFYYRRQQDGESIAAFMKVLQSLAANCNFSCAGCNTSTIDLHLRIQFIRGLKSSYIRGRLLRESDLTFSRATELALNMESPTQVLNEAAKEKQIFKEIQQDGGFPNGVEQDGEFSNAVKEEGESISAFRQPSEVAEQYKFYNRVQQDGESIAAFMNGLQSLTANCNFSCAGCNTSNIDLHLRIQFIRGLKSSYIRRRLLQESELTLSRATELALNMEYPTQENIHKTNSETSGEVNLVKQELQLSPSRGKSRSLFNVGPAAPLVDFPGFILFMKHGNNNSNPIQLLIDSAKVNLDWRKLDFHPKLLNSKERACEIRLNDKFLSSATVVMTEGGEKGNRNIKKRAREIAAGQGVRSLRRNCYTIKEKCPYFSSKPPIGKDQLIEIEADEYMDIDPDEIPEEKWFQKKESGMAQKNFKCLQRKLHIPFREILSEYDDSDTFEDLIFTDEFNNDERRVLHMLAESFNMRTKSHGKGANRHLVISKTISLSFLLDMLLANGGENEKYLVIPPTG